MAFNVFESHTGNIETDITNQFEPSVVERMSCIVLRKKSPAVQIIFADEVQIHACLGLPSSPILQGETPELSKRALQDWICRKFTNYHANSCIDLDTKSTYHQILFHELLNIQNQLFCPQWTVDCGAISSSCGKVWIVCSKKKKSCTMVSQIMGGFIK